MLWAVVLNGVDCLNRGHLATSGDSFGHHSRRVEDEDLLASESRDQGCCSPEDHRTVPQQGLRSPKCQQCHIDGAAAALSSVAFSFDLVRFPPGNPSMPRPLGAGWLGPGVLSKLTSGSAQLFLT